MSDCPTQKEVDAALKVLARAGAALQKAKRSKAFNWLVPLKGADMLLIRGPKKFREALLEGVEESVERFFSGGDL